MRSGSSVAEQNVGLVSWGVDLPASAEELFEDPVVKDSAMDVDDTSAAACSDEGAHSAEACSEVDAAAAAACEALHNAERKRKPAVEVTFGTV